MATTEMIVAITLIVVGVFYIIERLMYLAAWLFAWYYGKTVERNDNVDTPEPGEEIQGLN
jgi:hypothetical protein